MEVTAEVHFAQTLASNEKKFRDKALKRLHKYISARSCLGAGDGLNHEDFIKLWKGLHYCMWMQDKPVIQEELSKRMADLLHAFSNIQDALSFVNVFLITEAREWSGIDRLRLDKFMMLIRDVLHEMFVILSREEWPMEGCLALSRYMIAGVMNEDNPKLPFGLKAHLADIFITEMRKTSLQGIDGKKLTTLMYPFIYFVLKNKRSELVQSIFEKTIEVALKSFGIWSWKRGGKLQKKSRLDEEMSNSEEDSDDQDDEYEEMSDEAVDEEDMDTDDDDGNGKVNLKFDMCVLLRLLLHLAKDPKIESRNRTYIYGIVRSYSSRDASIQNSLNSEADDFSDVDISDVFLLTNSVVQKKKKRTRKRKIEVDGETKGSFNQQSTINQNNEKAVNGQDNKKAVSDQNNKKAVSDQNNNNKAGKTKKSATQHKLNMGKENNHTKTADNGKPPTMEKSKKRKRLSGDGEDIENSMTMSVKKRKTNWTIEDKAVPSSDSHVNKSPKHTATNLHKPKMDGSNTLVDSNSNLNINSNALSPKSKKSKKNVESLSSQIQCVIYPQKLQKPNSITTLSKSITSPQGGYELSKDSPILSAKKKRKQSLNSPSSTPSDSSLVSDNGESTKTQKKRGKKSLSPVSKKVKHETSETGDNEASGSGFKLLDNVINSLPSPSNLVKKVKNIVAPATDPGPIRQKTSSTQDQCMTPGSQKKVIFDLRRNKANKFKDYLKTLATDPVPAFEPTKSPSQSILKSPSVESLKTSSDDSTPTGKKRKMGKRKKSLQ